MVIFHTWKVNDTEIQIASMTDFVNTAAMGAKLIGIPGKRMAFVRDVGRAYSGVLGAFTPSEIVQFVNEGHVCVIG
jgi:hypothetical protein